ncbi:uncharacterized protein LOC129757968 [Uranotaenia lowii]|uniref:uncharacterized protein LOC129757968 n=1 Tax=Uranotaenia lowii TaxID=190385 RepID=UPI00247A5362|nr:uncharacterized protein LOC129757968 [Uranotaenia lowii]
MTYKSFDSSGFYLIVILTDSEELPDNLIRTVFEDLWKLDITNVNVLVTDTSKNQVLIYTFFPYSSTHCGVVEPQLWYNFTDVDESILLYPNRLQTFYGCPLKGGTLDALPYSVVNAHENSSKISQGGFEGDIVDLLKQRLNFTVEYKLPSTEELWGFIGKRGESTGLMRMIQEAEVDFAVGSLGFTYDRHHYLKPGVAHYTSEVVFAVSLGRPFTAFEKLFRPFQGKVWICIIAYLIIGLVVTNLLRLMFCFDNRVMFYGMATRTPYLNMLNIFFGGALPQSPGNNFARTVFFLWIYYTFIIRSAYQGSLYKYLQRTMNHPPLKTMDDIDRSGVNYYMMEIAKRFFVTMPSVLERTIFITPGKDSLGKTIEQLGRGELDGVVLVTSDYAAYHNKVFPKRQMVRITRELISAYPFGFYYPKKSRLTRVFDEQIRSLQPTGMIGFWIRRYGDYNFFEKPKQNEGLRALTNGHLAGGYQVFACLLGLSVVVFAIELASIRIVCLRKFLLHAVD